MFNLFIMPHSSSEILFVLQTKIFYIFNLIFYNRLIVAQLDNNLTFGNKDNDFFSKIQRFSTFF